MNGVVGEKSNKLLGYLAALSRKLDNPLAVMIQSTSAVDKSALMEAVLSFMPEEERMHYSGMTGQSLFYMGNIDLKHKILAISEEEGALFLMGLLDVARLKKQGYEKTSSGQTDGLSAPGQPRSVRYRLWVGAPQCPALQIKIAP